MRKWYITLIIILLLSNIFLVVYFTDLLGLKSKDISRRDIKGAEKIIGLKFSPEEQKMMLKELKRSLTSYTALRKIELPNSIPPALAFNPILPGMTFEKEQKPVFFTTTPDIQAPENPEELAYFPITKLSQLIRSQKITSLELTELYLKRLEKYGPELECIISLTADLARKQAQRADAEIAAGLWRGPLHGIPWGAKDLLDTEGIKTTWGAMPYKDRIPDQDATVVERLEQAGAVLVAKLTLGALAMGDYWYGGKTRNPWNLEQGSSGSSAGSAAATAAGLVGFAIGTETLGSIVSPSTRCGVTGLRPTFGRISRTGAMALSWSMDKIGPICRTVEDCAMVFNAIYGPDEKDLTIIDLPFNWRPNINIKKLRIGYLKTAFEQEYNNQANDLAVLDVFRSMDIELIPIELPEFEIDALEFLLTAEAAAAFDELTRSGEDDLLVRQNQGAWPNSFRQARFIPAVAYIQANRARTVFMQKMTKLLEKVDVYISPSFRGGNLLATNLAGHPTVVVPNGFNEKGSPTSISFNGGLYQEAAVLAVAKVYQDATEFHMQHPELDKNIELKK